MKLSTAVDSTPLASKYVRAARDLILAFCLVIVS